MTLSRGGNISQSPLAKAFCNERVEQNTNDESTEKLVDKMKVVEIANLRRKYSYFIVKIIAAEVYHV
ncbi:MAG: hypothetical protein IPP66_19165 [Anaerolineales bacterium]|nr:hypothetical protein [Anaerolineales bacterium]